MKNTNHSAAGRGRLLSTDPEAAIFHPPEKAEHCEFCGRVRPWLGMVIGGQAIWSHIAAPCDCAAARNARAEAARVEQARAFEDAQREKAERAAALMRSCNLGKRFVRRTFDNFKVTASNKSAFEAAKKFCCAILGNNAGADDAAEPDGLRFIGPPGTGKTHLAAAIVNQLVAAGIAIVFTPTVSFFAGLKETYDAGSEESEIDVMRSYKTAPLLVLDDLGKELPTAWALSKLYDLINARYEECLPVVITSNYTKEFLIKALTPATGDDTTAVALVDRLEEMTQEFVLTGQSWRSGTHGQIPDNRR